MYFRVKILKYKHDKLKSQVFNCLVEPQGGTLQHADHLRQFFYNHRCGASAFRIILMESGINFFLTAGWKKDLKSSMSDIQT